MRNCLFFICVFFFQCVYGEISDNALSTPNHQTNHILFLMHTGNTAEALEAYKTYSAEIGAHDFDLLEQIGLILLDQGFRTRDSETQVLTLFGAGISANEKALYIVEDAVTARENPQLELIALHFLARTHNDRADQILLRAMASDFLLIRLEALLELASKKDARAIRQIEALMAKVPEMLWPIFPQIYALLDTPEAKKGLRKLLAHPDEAVRVAAINSIADHDHDDFLPSIKRLASQNEPTQQEACAAAFGTFRDESSYNRLLEFSKSSHPFVRLSALKALYDLGHQEVRAEIEARAKQQDLFAINLLGKIKGSEQTLAALTRTPHLLVSMNAALSLLELGDSRCVPFIIELLLNDVRDYGVLKCYSPAKSLEAWKIIPSARQNFADDAESQELSLMMREAIIAKAVELPEKEFLYLAAMILEKQHNELIPILISALQSHPTPAVIALLKKYQQQAGAPLVRNYCNLALYTLKQPGPYGDNLRKWVSLQQNIDLIQFRPLMSIEQQTNHPSLSAQLTAKETSRLLIEAFEAFVSTQDDKGIDLLISIIQTGNPKNKFALIGLLMRAIQ